MAMTCHKLWNVISFCVPIIQVLFVNIKMLMKLKNRLNVDSSNICDWFADNKVSIHFGEDKTKSILFASKNILKKALKKHLKT